MCQQQQKHRLKHYPATLPKKIFAIYQSRQIITNGSRIRQLGIIIGERLRPIMMTNIANLTSAISSCRSGHISSSRFSFRKCPIAMQSSAKVIKGEKMKNMMHQMSQIGAVSPIIISQPIWKLIS